MRHSDSYYHSVIARYGGRMVQSDGVAAMSPGFPGHRVIVGNVFGQERWLTPATDRVRMACREILQRDSSWTTTQEIASMAGVSRGTVSKALVKLQAFGFLAADIARGRHGGVLLLFRSVGDTFARFADRAWERLRRNVSKTRMQVVTTPNSTSTYRGNISDTDRFERDKALAAALQVDPNRASGRVPCPAHGEGRSKTLSWKWQGERLLVHCFAGCTFAEIRQAAGL